MSPSLAFQHTLLLIEEESARLRPLSCVHVGASDTISFSSSAQSRAPRETEDDAGETLLAQQLQTPIILGANCNNNGSNSARAHSTKEY